MKKIFLIVLLIGISNLYSQTENNSQWETIDYTLMSAYVVGQVADFGITNYAIKNINGVNEGNPIFGKNPNMYAIAGAKLAVTGVVYYLTTKVARNKTERRIALVAANILAWTPVILNVDCLTKNGYQVKFSFSL